MTNPVQPREPRVSTSPESLKPEDIKVSQMIWMGCFDVVHHRPVIALGDWRAQCLADGIDPWKVQVEIELIQAAERAPSPQPESGEK